MSKVSYLLKSRKSRRNVVNVVALSLDKIIVIYNVDEIFWRNSVGYCEYFQSKDERHSILDLIQCGT